MKKTTLTAYGKKNIWWFIELCFLTPFWAFCLDDKKTFHELSCGCMQHKCRFTQTCREAGREYRLCSHIGCNTVEAITNN